MSGPALEPDALMQNRWLMSQSFFLIHRTLEVKKKAKKIQHGGVAEGQWGDQNEQQIGVLGGRKEIKNKTESYHIISFHSLCLLYVCCISPNANKNNILCNC